MAVGISFPRKHKTISQQHDIYSRTKLAICLLDNKMQFL